MNYIKTLSRDDQPILIGYEIVSRNRRNLYNHTQLIGYAERKSIFWWKGYLLDGTHVTGNHSLTRIGLEILEVQERMQ